MTKSEVKHLAWHETLEMHELTAFQSIKLMSFKKMLKDIHEPKLKALYVEAIRGLEQNLRELLPFYPLAPAHRQAAAKEPVAVEAGELLGFAKTAVRNYAIAITETATPQLRQTFERHLDRAIQLHGKVFGYMCERGLYNAYDLEQLLASDVALANEALAYSAT